VWSLLALAVLAVSIAASVSHAENNPLIYTATNLALLLDARECIHLVRKHETTPRLSKLYVVLIVAIELVVIIMLGLSGFTWVHPANVSPSCHFKSSSILVTDPESGSRTPHFLAGVAQGAQGLAFALT
jgi:hypothetical protein